MATFKNRFEGPISGQIYQAGRDLTVANTSTGSLDPLIATKHLRDLRVAVGQLGLSPGNLRTAHQDLDDVEQELRNADPDTANIARGLRRLTETLKSAGALASAGAAILGPIGIIAGFLGPVGQSILEAASEL